MITIGSMVWVERAFIESVGEDFGKAMQAHRVLDLSRDDVLLEGFDNVWIPIRACALDRGGV